MRQILNKCIFLSIIFLLNCFGNIFSPSSIYHATNGCKDYVPIKQFWAGDKITDVSFIAFGDTQVFLDIDTFKTEARQDHGRKNDIYKKALNVAEKVDWSAFGIKQSFSNVRGVIMPGDITQNGRDGRWRSENEYEIFTRIYGLCGNGEIKYPMYEGYGNHDYFEWSHIAYRIPKKHPVVDYVSLRNKYRVGILNTAPGKDGHYSWEWDNIHFIQLNLCPSDVKPKLKISGLRDPRNALTFLKNNLEKHVKNTSKKVVIIAHYQPDGDSNGFEYTKSQAKTFYQVIKYYPVIAYIHGHNHGTSTYEWKGIPVFNAGSPYAKSYTVFRITDKYIYAQDVGFSKKNPEKLKFPYKWKRKINISKIISKKD